MEAAWRRLARRMPVVAVGPAVARRYAHSPAVLEIVVSLISAAEVVDAATALPADYGDELTALSVGRLETEKNPLLLADVLAAINREEPHWRLVVCGEGALEGPLRERLDGARGFAIVPSCAATSRSGRSSTRSTDPATRCCTSLGPRAFRRCCWRPSPRGYRWWRPTSAESGRRWGMRPCWSSPETPSAAASRTWPNSRGRIGTAPPHLGRSRLRRQTYGRDRDGQRRALPRVRRPRGRWLLRRELRHRKVFAISVRTMAR